MASRILALLLALPLFLVALGAGIAQNPAPLPKVPVSQPLPREVTDHTDFRGIVEPGETAEAHARVGGEVISIAFKPGETVKKGAQLLQIDPRPYRAALEKAEAEMERAQAAVKRATAELARVTRLAKSAAISKEEVELAVIAQTDAQAGLKAARAGVELARLNLEQTQVIAPITGKVGRPAVVAGSVVTAGARLVTIEAMDHVHISFGIDERTALYLTRAKAGKKPLEITPQVGLPDETGLPHRGRLDLTDLRFNPTTGTAQARVTLSNPDGLFLPGLSASVRLVEGKPYKALMISSLCMRSDAQGPYVLVVNPPGIVERRNVKISRLQGGLYPVTAGLKETDLVIVSATISARGLTDDVALVVGMAVAPEKVAMPERLTRPDVWDKAGFGKMGGSRGKGKGKGGPGRP